MKHVRWIVLFMFLVASIPSLAFAQEPAPDPLPQSPTEVVEFQEPEAPAEEPDATPPEPPIIPDEQEDTNPFFPEGEPIMLIPSPLQPSDPSPVEQPGGVGRIADTTIVTDSYKVTFLKTETHTATNTSTWYYRMEVMTTTVTATVKLESWMLQLPGCVTVQSSTPAGTFVNPDPTTRLSGIKWNLPDGFTAGEFRVTLAGPVVEGATQVAVKSSQASFNVDYTAITGPSCMDGSRVELANGDYRVSLLSYVSNSDGTFTYEYYIEAFKGRIPIEWELPIGSCMTVKKVAGGLKYEIKDGKITWKFKDKFKSGRFTVTLAGPIMVGNSTLVLSDTLSYRGLIMAPTCKPGTTLTLGNGDYRVSLLSHLVNPDGTFTYEYFIEALKGRIPVEWELPIGTCMNLKKAAGGLKYEIKDGKIKWKFKDHSKSDRFSLTLAGPIIDGHSTVVISDTLSFSGLILAPTCKIPDVRVVHRSSPSKKSIKKAVIVFNRPTTTIEVKDGLTYIVSTLVLRNSTCSGPAWDFVVHTDMDDDLELDDRDVQYTNATGAFLVNNPWRKSLKIDLKDKTLSCGTDVQVKFKYKVKPNRKKDKVTLIYHLEYSDKDDRIFVPPMILEVPVTQSNVVGVVVPRLTIDHIEPRMKRFWERGGGLRVYGYPITVARVRPSGVVVQYFERARLEYHPELEGTGFEVLGGLLGVELGYREAPLPPPDVPTRWYFVETGHTIGEPFRAFWQANDGLKSFGYPIGVPVVKDGLTVQYFERVRLEVHPELQGTDYHILLGFLGEECLKSRCGGDDDGDG